jgi:prophage DNA circulation protein
MNDGYDERPAAILGTTRTVRTTVDGSMIFQVEIEPRHAQAAFALFGAPGTPIGMARLDMQVAKAQAQRETAVGGPLAKLAGQFCNSDSFRSWLRRTYDPLPQSADDAATIVRSVCKVDSRAMLDHDEAAAEIFHREFRVPFSAWQQRR